MPNNQFEMSIKAPQPPQDQGPSLADDINLKPKLTLGESDRTVSYTPVTSQENMHMLTQRRADLCLHRRIFISTWEIPGGNIRGGTMTKKYGCKNDLFGWCIVTLLMSYFITNMAQPKENMTNFMNKVSD